jgi:CspA family cold shock protein
MAKGTVKWFNSTKVYGFIQSSAGGKVVFVHISGVERAGLSTLNEGQVAEYKEVSNKGKTSAENLKLPIWRAPTDYFSFSASARFCIFPYAVAPPA